MKRALGAIVGGWALWRLFGPELAPRFSAPQEHPAPIPGKSVFVGPREFFVREAGEGPPLVLLHGWGYPGLATWYRAVPTLAESNRVVLVDLRNHGRSDHIRGSFTIEDVADEVAAVLDRLQIGDAVVAGYSMGGMVAQAMAHRHPRTTRRVVLAATAARPIGRYRIAHRAAMAVARGIGRFSITEWARLTLRYLRRVGAVAREHERWLWETLLHRDSGLSFESGFAAWHFDSRDWVTKLDVPALVIIPTADQLVDPAAQRELADLLPDAETLELPGARHEAVLTHGEEIAKAISLFAQG